MPARATSGSLAAAENGDGRSVGSSGDGETFEVPSRHRTVPLFSLGDAGFVLLLLLLLLLGIYSTFFGRPKT